jgi:hypothetical protein
MNLCNNKSYAYYSKIVDNEKTTSHSWNFVY